MKVKTSELTGAALDWAVAKCEGLLGEVTQARTFGALCKERGGVVFTHSRLYSPSTNWLQGGPIIEREMANGLHMHGGGLCVAMYFNEKLGGFEGEYYGPTPLIAACRAFVVSRLGSEVEVPDGLA